MLFNLHQICLNVRSFNNLGQTNEYQMLSLSFSGLSVCHGICITSSVPESDKLIRDVSRPSCRANELHIDTEELKSLRTDILVLCPASDALRQESLRVLNERVARHGDLKE